MNARRLLQLVLLVQAMAALLIAWTLARHGLPWWLGVPAGVLAVALARLLINMNNFALSSLFASPTPAMHRIGPGARLKMLAGEYRASMLVTTWHMARARAAMRVHGGAHPDSRVPVLLLHGYGCNAGYWARLAPRLDAAGISHATLDLEPVGCSIDEYAPLVERAVQSLRAATGARYVAIVGHSMGGLVARAWLRAYGQGALDRTARLITLGTPHHGTGLARFGVGANARQMRHGGKAGPSPWLRALAAGEGAAVRRRITSIYTHHDNIVSPQTSSELPGARHIAFGGIGHVALGHDARVLAAVMEELASLSAGSGR